MKEYSRDVEYKASDKWSVNEDNDYKSKVSKLIDESREVVDKYHLRVDEVEYDGTFEDSLIIPLVVSGKETAYFAESLSNRSNSKFLDEVKGAAHNRHLIDVEGKRVYLPVFESVIDSVLFEIIEGYEAIGIPLDSSGNETGNGLSFNDSPHTIAFVEEKKLSETSSHPIARYTKSTLTIPNRYKDVRDWMLNDSKSFSDRLQEHSGKILLKNSLTNFTKHEYLKRVSEIHKQKPRTTGIDELDTKLGGGLYKGVHVLGGHTSIGKTALATFISYCVAMNGDPVVYYSLEMDKVDLVNRYLSLRSRITQHGYSFSYSSIYDPKFDTAKLNSIIDEFSKEEGMLIHVIDRKECSTIESMSTHILNVKEVTRKNPLVVIDYLQILGTEKSSFFSTKDMMDYLILEIKKLADELSCPIIVLSSLSRSARKYSFHYDSLKETGGIEYTADTIIGLYEKENSPDDTVYLKIAKNRKGKKETELKLNYEAKYNFFKYEPPVVREPTPNIV